MKRSTFVIATAAAVLVATIGARAAAPQAKPASADAAVMSKSVGDMTADEEQRFSDAAEATIQRVCLACHPFENIAKTRRTAHEWNDQVNIMKGRGAPGTDRDFEIVKKYLVRYYGVVHVNVAPAEELAAVLGLPAKVAAAVVEYRTAHGNFTDMASLEKVEGVDKAKLDDEVEALRFD